MQWQESIEEAMDDEEEEELDFIVPIKQLSKSDSSGLVPHPLKSFSQC